jgi:hypothetical protein
LDLDDAQHAIYVHEELAGPDVPENPLARLVPKTPDSPMLVSRAAAIARMRTARIVCLRRHFDRQNLRTA